MPIDARKRLLSSLSLTDFTFSGTGTRHLTHGIHSFPAKFPPKLPNHFISTLSKEGDIVLDPMVGSGTTLVEASISGRLGVGVDIDPLAVLLSQVKTRKIDICAAQRLLEKISIKITRRLAETSPLYNKKERHEYNDSISNDEETREFLSYWFTPKTIYELSCLIDEILNIEDIFLRNVFQIAFSNTIFTKNGGVSLSRDLAHTRPHKVEKKPVDVMPLFKKGAIKVLKGLHDYSQQARCEVEVIRGDATKLSLIDESVDLIFTSPPYAIALDYLRASKFSLTWFGYSIPSLKKLRPHYIGSQGRPNRNVKSELGKEVLSKIENKQTNASLTKYFNDMQDCINEAYRVLKPANCALFVVGPSTIKGMNMPTHLILADIGEKIGFEVLNIKEREIERNGRQLPFSFNSNMKGIEGRIHKEYIIPFYKK